jgi:hypothetical protein
MYIGKHIVQLGRDLATTNDDYQILDDACEIAYNSLRNKSNSFVFIYYIMVLGLIMLDVIGDFYGRNVGVLLCFSL